MADYPISKEAVIKELVELREMMGCSCISIGLTMAIDRLNGFPQFETPAPEWISVEERLPEHEVRVQLGYSRMQFVDQGYLDREEMDWYDEYDNRVARPTHWMPLAEPPKQGGMKHD